MGFPVSPSGLLLYFRCMTSCPIQGCRRCLLLLPSATPILHNVISCVVNNPYLISSFAACFTPTVDQPRWASCCYCVISWEAVQQNHIFSHIRLLVVLFQKVLSPIQEAAMMQSLQSLVFAVNRAHLIGLGLDSVGLLMLVGFSPHAFCAVYPRC